MKLSEHFTLAEFTRSAKADELGIANTPREPDILRMCILCLMVLEPLRRKVGKPVHISSGFRNAIVNKEVGGSATSDHMHGRAADVFVDGMTPMELLISAKESVPDWDQMYEHRSAGFVHVSFRLGGNRRQILHPR